MSTLKVAIGVNAHKAKPENAKYTVYESCGVVNLTILKKLPNGQNQRVRISLTKEQAYELASSLSIQQSVFFVRWRSE